MNLLTIFRRQKPSIPKIKYDLSYLEDEEPKMRKLYSRVLTLMEEKKPYLDGNFSIGQLSRTLFCNRAFVSKTINLCSGHNFRWLINSYRVRYAAQLMRDDPMMKIEEVARLSGFNTLPTFNSAFKMNMKERPSEYLTKIRRSQGRRLSKSLALRP